MGVTNYNKGASVLGDITSSGSATFAGTLTTTGTTTATGGVAFPGGTATILNIPLTALANTDDTATSVALPANAIVTDVILQVTTAEATATTKTIDIGTLSTDSGDADGFAAALSTAATGIIRPGVTVTTGTNTKYFSANTRGVLLSDYQAGTDVDQDEGVYLETPDTTMGGKTITVTAGEAQTEFAGVLKIFVTSI